MTETAQRPEFELVVPAYNESKTLQMLVERAAEAAKAAGFTPERFRMVVVENGSTDDSAQVLATISATELGRWLKVVSVKPNQGYGFGLWSGLQATSAPVVACSHADFQCDPKDAFIGYARIKDSKVPLLVKGERSGRNPRDIFVSRVFETLAWLFLGLKVKEMNAQPKVFPRSLLAQMTDPPKTFAFDLYVMYCAAKAGLKVQAIPVIFPSRIHGASKWASNFLSRYKTILGIIAYMRRLRSQSGRVS